MPLKDTCLQPYQVPAASLASVSFLTVLSFASIIVPTFAWASNSFSSSDVQAPCLELPSVHACSPLMSSGHACKQMPPGMLCPVQLAHYAKLCRKKVSGQILCLTRPFKAAAIACGIPQHCTWDMYLAASAHQVMWRMVNCNCAGHSGMERALL